MDWSAIYEEHGDEDGDWTSFSNRLTPMLQNFSSRGKYTPLVCYLFTVNYVLGVGCLGVPFAFLKSGVILGSILIVVLSIVAYMTVMWVAESGYRELEIRKLESSMTPVKRRDRLSMETQSLETTPLQHDVDSLVDSTAAETPNKSYGAFSKLESEQEVEFSSLATLIQEEEMRIQSTPSPFSPKHNFMYRGRLSSDDYHGDFVDSEAEVVELVLQFLGPKAKSLYQISVMLLMIIGLTAYTQVFFQTFEQQIWPNAPFSIPIVLYAGIVVPLSCVDLAEQINIQVVMALMRFVSLVTLVLGTVVAMYFDSVDSGYQKFNDQGNKLPLVDFAGFSLMFTTAIFSQLFQHSVPGLIRPLPSREKRNVSRVFMAALCTTGMFYVLIGTTCVYYFGPQVNQAINLNFVNFDWGLSDSPMFIWLTVRLLSMIVVIFPALDTLSVYPLIGNTLGNNLSAYFPDTWLILKLRLENYDVEPRSKCEWKKAARRCWRFVAAVPPIAMSLFVTDLSLTLQFAGLCGILVALITPSLLQYYSIIQYNRACDMISSNDKLSQEENPYKGAFSSQEYTYVTTGLAVIAIVACSYQIYLATTS